MEPTAENAFLDVWRFSKYATENPVLLNVLHSELLTFCLLII